MYWNQKEWLFGMPNIVNDLIISGEEIVFPPLHIKLGIIKQFVRALNTVGLCFQHIDSVFPALSFEKIKVGVFDGPQIRVHVCDQNFVRKMKDKERGAWFSFVAIMKHFLRNKKANNYKTLVTNLFSAFHDLGCNMSVKFHFSYSHLDRFPDNLEAVNDEQGVRFH